MPECLSCGKTFSHTGHLNRHLREVHKNPPQRTSRIINYLRCPTCNDIFKSPDSYEKHLVETHEFRPTKESYIFSNIDEFREWKCAIEDSENSRYVIRNSKCISGHKTMYYRCNRSGEPRSRVNPDDRKREWKKQGSSKASTFCPARIIAKCSVNRVDVVFNSGHYGHNFELDHLPIPLAVKEQIATQIASNVPVNVILDNCRRLCESGELKRINIINRQDLRNIIRDYSLDSDALFDSTKESNFQLNNNTINNPLVAGLSTKIQKFINTCRTDKEFKILDGCLDKAEMAIEAIKNVPPDNIVLQAPASLSNVFPYQTLSDQYTLAACASIDIGEAPDFYLEVEVRSTDHL